MTPGQAAYEQYCKGILFPPKWAALPDSQKQRWEDIAAAGIAVHEERKAPEADGEEKPRKRSKK